MKKTTLTLISVITLLGFVVGVSAQEVQTITVGGNTIEYTQVYEDLENTQSYYNEETLVLTEFDSNDDGEVDAWTLYRSDMSVEKELLDSDGDGKVDITFEYDTDENLIKESGEGLKQFEIEPFIEPVAETETENTPLNEEVDYAGDLTDIEKLAGEGGSMWTWIFIGVVVIGLYMKFRKRK